MNAIPTPSVSALRMFAPLFDDGEFEIVHRLSGQSANTADLAALAALQAWPTAELLAALTGQASLPPGLAARLAEGDTIWVRKGTREALDNEARAILAALRRHGPNRLLYVVLQSEQNEGGSVEMLTDGLLCGHVSFFMRPESPPALCLEDWREICLGARLLTLIEAAPGERRPPSPSHVKANLLPGTERFEGPWAGRDQVARFAPATAPPPPHADAVVMAHQLIADTDDSTATIFGRYVPDGLTQGACYIVSLYVWLPLAFEGRVVGAVCDGFASEHLANADLAQRETWQRIWVRSRIPAHLRAANPQLYVVGRAGSRLYSACWKLEPGFAPSDWRGAPTTL